MTSETLAGEEKDKPFDTMEGGRTMIYTEILRKKKKLRQPAR